MSSATYQAQDIEVLSGLEPVQRRPGMYTDTARPNHLAQEVIDLGFELPRPYGLQLIGYWQEQELILDNLSSHKSVRAAEVLRDVGAWFLFLPPYSPDLNPIEMAFAKLKALIRRAAARTYEDLWRAAGQVCDLFTEQECYNFFRAAGYETD